MDVCVKSRIFLGNYKRKNGVFGKNREKGKNITMTEQDKIRALDLVTKYRSESLDDIELQKYTYHYLASVKWCYGIDKFNDIRNEIYRVNIDKMKKMKKIKVVFLVAYVSTWSCESLYRILKEDVRFETYLVVHPFLNGTDNTIIDAYKKVLNYFVSRGYPVVGAYDIDANENLNWMEIGSPDIIFHLNPHYKLFPKSLSIYNFPLSTLNIYIPYGFMIYGHVESQFNQMSHLLYWKIFCESELHKNMSRLYSDIGDSNVLNSGYLKMDMFYDGKLIDYNEIWKIQSKYLTRGFLKIIYAPHHSLGNNACAFSTFSDNAFKFYEYAKEHPEISWIIKPHPLLKKATIENRYFESEQEYDNYIKLWDELPNARSFEENIYIDVFKSSDAMILDSVSFLSEYLYTGKPYLFLTRDGQTFNDYGKELYSVLYTAKGDKWEEIELFIEDILIRKNDVKFNDRKTFFDKYLNYTLKNNILASEFIYEHISNCLY